MNDEREILNLLYRYCELQDAADFVGVAELFRLADKAGLFRDPERAAARMKAVMAVRGVAM